MEAAGGASGPAWRKFLARCAEFWRDAGIGFPLAVGIGSRIALYALIGVFAGLMPGEPETKGSLLDSLSRWDGEWYLSIARDGYVWRGPAAQSNVVFWPLYPALGKAAGFLLGDLRLGFLAVTNLAYLAFLALLYRLAADDFDAGVARRATIFAAVFPGAFVLGAFYTEALSFALAVGAFHCARRGRWPAAIALGALTGLTRFPANAIVVPLAWEMLRQRGLSWRLLTLALVPAGALAFMAYIGVLTGDPTAVVSSQYSAWYRLPMAPWQTAAAALERVSWPWTHYVVSVGLLDAGSIVLFAALTVWALLRMPAAYGLYSLIVLVGALSVGMDPAKAPPTASVSRFLMAVFPGYIALGQFAKNSVVEQTLQWVFVVLMAGFSLYFFSGTWVL